MSDLAFQAMMFARVVHAGQTRKYTGAPYTDHLAEVAGIVAAAGLGQDGVAVAWLHDCIEDQDVPLSDLDRMFGHTVAEAVLLLSDLETGNRRARKAASRARLSTAPGWVQTVKLADLISNTSSIVQHDPDFAKVYLAEKRALLAVMTRGDPRLWSLAHALASQPVPA